MFHKDAFETRSLLADMSVDAAKVGAELAVQQERRKRADATKEAFKKARERVIEIKEKLKANNKEKEAAPQIETVEKLIVENEKALEENRKAITAELEELSCRLAVIAAQETKMKISLSKAEVAVEYCEKASTLDNWISWTSIALAAAGFALWYLKIQRYQDIILAHQAMLLK